MEEQTKRNVSVVRDADAKAKANAAFVKQPSKDSIYRILKSFDKIYGEFTDAEKKRFIGSFVEKVEIYEEEQEDMCDDYFDAAW